MDYMNAVPKMQSPGEYAEKQQLDPYANHAQAIARWHEACRQYQAAAEQKEKANQNLEQANKILRGLYTRRTSRLLSQWSGVCSAPTSPSCGFSSLFSSSRISSFAKCHFTQLFRLVNSCWNCVIRSVGGKTLATVCFGRSSWVYLLPCWRRVALP